jgi:hypothetical protein
MHLLRRFYKVYPETVMTGLLRITSVTFLHNDHIIGVMYFILERIVREFFEFFVNNTGFANKCDINTIIAALFQWPATSLTGHYLPIASGNFSVAPLLKLPVVS